MTSPRPHILRVTPVTILHLVVLVNVVQQVERGYERIYLQQVPKITAARNSILPRPSGSASFSGQELYILRLCRELRDLPEAPRGFISEIQSAASAGDERTAVSLLAQYLDKNNLDPRARRVTIDPARLAACRQGVTQASLARQLGVTPQQVSHVEQGRNGISLQRFLLLLAILDVTPEDLVPQDGQNSKPGSQDNVHPLRLDRQDLR